MSARIAVINEVHSVSVKILGWMLQSIGFTVCCSGPSFRGIMPLYHTDHSRHPKDICRGSIEFKHLPPDALLVDTHPDAVAALRSRGWNGPILLVWQMPVGPDWVRENLKPSSRVGSLGWSTSVGREVARMNICPNDHFWPPYCGIALDQTQRSTVGDWLITIVENADGWSNPGVLRNLRDHPRTRLELYGGGPPDWSRKIPQDALFARIRGSLAMYHLKPFDTPGLAVMEAALQGVPILFPHDWVRLTGSEELFEDGRSCFIVPTDAERVVEVAERLRDPELNRSIGSEGRRRMLAATDWTVNRQRFQDLIAQL